MIGAWLNHKAEEEQRQLARAEARAKADKSERRTERWTEGWSQGWSEGWSKGWDEGRTKGFSEGREQMDDSWTLWYGRMKKAEQNGEPFDEPPPHLRRRTEAEPE